MPRKTLILFLVLMMSIPSVSAVWWNADYQYSTVSPIADGLRPYQIRVNISSTSGTNNASWIYTNGHANADFSDVRFLLDNTTLLPYWKERTYSNYATFWVNLTANGTVNAYYGNTVATTLSNGGTTFFLFDNFSDGNLDGWTLTNTPTASTDWSSEGDSYSIKFDGSNLASERIQKAFSVGDVKLVADGKCNDCAVSFFLYDYTTSARILETIDVVNNWESTAITSPTTAHLGQGFGATPGSFTGYLDNIRVRKYKLPEPTWAAWGAEYSIFTIQSFGNNYTNDQQTEFQISTSTNISFNITMGGQNRTDQYDWYKNSVNQSQNTTRFNTTINQIGTTNITVVAVNKTYGDFATKTWNVTLPISLVSPANNSVEWVTSPPYTKIVNFTWQSNGYPWFHIILSTDQNFNYITNEAYTANKYYSFTLTNATYYWKVQNYNSDTMSYTDYATPYIFTLGKNISGQTNLATIFGVVYEVANGVITPINGAKVRIYNSTQTWSSDVITGSNGYYQFTGLQNGTTYYLQASKIDDFEDGALEMITTGYGNWTERNLLLQRCVSGFNCFYNKHYQFFVIKWANGTALEDATVTIYRGSEVASYASDTTDSDGTVVFLLIKNQKYRATIIKASEGVSESFYFYPTSPTEPIIYIVGEIAWATPTGTPPTNMTNYTINRTTKPWSIQNLTNASLSSQIGLSSLGQGVVAGTVNWFIVGAGGPIATIFVSGIMAYLGILTWGTILFYSLTVTSLYILVGGRF